MMPASAVKIEDLWKSFDGRRFVLKGVNLHVSPGDTILISGRSGSGKTTLLSMIGCIDTPTRGDLHLNGYNVADLSARSLARIRLKYIGIVFQAHNLINDLSILDNVVLPLKIARNKDAKKKAEDLLNSFDLIELRDMKPNAISGGERQRAAIARALANNPSILLADEPTNSLDADNCNLVLDAFQKANRLFGTTLIIASHDPMVAEHVKSQYHIQNGTLIRMGN